MTANAEQTTSVWMQTEKIPCHAALAADTQADVCVIGAGIAGMTTAYLLLQEGKSVVVLDDGPVGGGQTQRTTGHLSNALDDRYVEIEGWHGLEGARLAAESHSAAIDRIEALVARESIACDFERLDGFLFAPPGDSGELLEHELQAARRAGLADVELVPRSPMAAFDTGPCLRFPGQAQFHPLKYLAGLTQAILNRGGRVFTQAHAEEIQRGFPAHIPTRQGPTVTASAVVVATNTPFNDLLAIHTKQAPYMSYVVAFGVPRGSVAKALYWDTLDPYHYVRWQALRPADPAGEQLGDPQTEELLIVGGEDHKTGQADDAEVRYNRLEAWTRVRFPVQGTVRCRWSGQVLETIDGLAFIGRNPIDAANVFVATGDSGMGMTHGTIAGILLTDMIVGRRNPWAALYDPSRKMLLATGTFLQESLNIARQYGAWLTGGDVASAQEILPGHGAIVRRGLLKMAAFCDEQGVLHECSAICPHLGCLVEWNHNESTWDCPCHGSRFDKLGCVLNGPANSDLAPIREA
jgi:glycine/D-amino acid oxidase-like deaminating enzyme/nitrite reductase/ring-hydroxylating ferredoxin subunit